MVSPVTPGTSFITVAGAIASDIHGKNHHVAGTFGQHILSMKILLGTGEVITASRTECYDIFKATCGGMGLTGIILTATLKLLPIKSAFIKQRTIRLNSIEEVCEAFDNYHSSQYSVAWIDCLASGKNLGRSLLMIGQHIKNGVLNFHIKDPKVVPFYTPAVFLNRISLKTFNYVYYRKAGF